MPAPTTLRTSVGNLLNTLWDAVEAGTAFDTEWAHSSIFLAAGGRNLVLQIGIDLSNGQPVMVIRIKRL
jgi:hypothetical protein